MCRLLFHCQKAACTFTETRLILNTMMIIPLVQVLYYDGIVKTNMIGFGWSSGLQTDER